MSQVFPTNKEDKVRAIYAFAEDLLQQGHTKLEVQKALVEKGMETDLAAAVVERVVKLKTQSLKKERARSKRIQGVFILLIGLVCVVKVLSSPHDAEWILGTVIWVSFIIFRLPRLLA